MDPEKAVRIALEKGADEVSVKRIEQDDIQLRFSNNMADISNNWVSSSMFVFIAVNGRTTGIKVERSQDMEKEIEKGIKFAKNLPENPDFLGIYEKKSSPAKPELNPLEIEDLSDMGRKVIDSASKNGIKRVSGEIYLARHNITVATQYNLLNEKRSYLLTTARAFNNEGHPGQASTHIADSRDLSEFGPEFVGKKAGELAAMNRNVKDGREGDFTVLMDPLCFGSMMTQVGSSLSAFTVDSGMSFFMNKIGEQVASEVLTAYDDPHIPGSGMGSFDDEGAPSRRSAVIEKGMLKTYLHSTSTAKKYDTETTGNSRMGGGYFAPGGSIIPSFWQIYVDKGKKSWKDMLSDIDEGLYIANTWYTRYQNKVSGDFSTIPRDGIFYIENGEIKEAWKGIRISDNILKILKNIRELSSESIPADWWGETSRIFAPYALIEDVHITKAR